MHVEDATHIHAATFIPCTVAGNFAAYHVACSTCFNVNRSATFSAGKTLNGDVLNGQYAACHNKTSVIFFPSVLCYCAILHCKVSTLERKHTKSAVIHRTTVGATVGEGVSIQIQGHILLVDRNSLLNSDIRRQCDAGVVIERIFKLLLVVDLMRPQHLRLVKAHLYLQGRHALCQGIALRQGGHKGIVPGIGPLGGVVFAGPGTQGEGLLRPIHRGQNGPGQGTGQKLHGNGILLGGGEIYFPGHRVQEPVFFLLRLHPGPGGDGFPGLGPFRFLLSGVRVHRGLIGVFRIFGVFLVPGVARVFGVFRFPGVPRVLGVFRFPGICRVFGVPRVPGVFPGFRGLGSLGHGLRPLLRKTRHGHILGHHTQAQGQGANPAQNIR